jgi:hypothetical protein
MSKDTVRQEYIDYHRRIGLLNMVCSYNEHDELVDLIRDQVNSYKSQPAPLWIHKAKEILDRLDHYDIELQELNKKLREQK